MNIEEINIKEEIKIILNEYNNLTLRDKLKNKYSLGDKIMLKYGIRNEDDYNSDNEMGKGLNEMLRINQKIELYLNGMHIIELIYNRTLFVYEYNIDGVIYNYYKFMTY